MVVVVVFVVVVVVGTLGYASAGGSYAALTPDGQPVSAVTCLKFLELRSLGGGFSRA